jgi:hypothetical protein
VAAVKPRQGRNPWKFFGLLLAGVVDQVAVDARGANGRRRVYTWESPSPAMPRLATKIAYATAGTLGIKSSY